MYIVIMKVKYQITLHYNIEMEYLNKKLIVHFSSIISWLNNLEVK